MADSPSGSERDSFPLFSIIIPTRDRAQQLRVCLEAIRGMDFPRKDFEVIVVDDGSTTAMDSVVAPFTQALNLTLVRQPNAGPAAARNTGAECAKGSLLAFTDDDCAPDPGWLRALAGYLACGPGRMVGGKTRNTVVNNPFASASQQLISYLYEYYNADPANARFFTSNNLALPAEEFRQIGGFDTGFPRAAGEDRELCDRWSFRGYQLVYAPNAIVNHAHALTLGRFWRQHVNYGRAAMHFHRLRARRLNRTIRTEPLSFYLKMLRYPFSQREDGPAWVHSALLGLSQVANAIGFVQALVAGLVERGRARQMHSRNEDRRRSHE
jgi:glycosyltransferase involved in cell wall biosynthesis